MVAPSEPHANTIARRRSRSRGIDVLKLDIIRPDLVTKGTRAPLSEDVTPRVPLFSAAVDAVVGGIPLNPVGEYLLPQQLQFPADVLLQEDARPLLSVFTGPRD